MTYYNNISGKELYPTLVLEARKQELEIIDTMRVWGVRVIPTRWVGVNKGDDVNPFIRSRFVAKDMKRKGGIAGEEFGFECFAAMSPLAAARLQPLACFWRCGPYKSSPPWQAP